MSASVAKINIWKMKNMATTFNLLRNILKPAILRVNRGRIRLIQEKLDQVPHKKKKKKMI